MSESFNVTTKGNILTTITKYWPPILHNQPVFDGPY